MTKQRISLFALLTILAAMLAAPGSAAAAHSVKDLCVSSVDETDPAEAGPVSICVSVFKPASASSGNRAPVILHSHGWGGSRTKTVDSFTDYLDAGFGVVSIDQRGFGESGGKAHVEDPDFEGQDMIAVVDYIADQSWVAKDGPNDPVLGAMGGSYGGGYQMVLAFTEIMEKGRTRLNAIAPEITWWSLNESLAPNDVVRTGWVSALYAAGANAHTTQVHAGFAEGLATGNWPQSMDDFFTNNGPRWHVRNGRKLDIPVLFRQGASDNLFPLDQALKNFDRALTRKARAESILVGYNGGHALPSAVPLGYASGSDACSATLGGGDKSVKDFGSLALQFFREQLTGARGTITGQGAYHLTTADGKCVHTKSVKANKTFSAGEPVTTAGAGAPQAIKLADGPFTVAGTPFATAEVTSAGLDNRAFFALSVGTSPADAKVIQNNTLPHRETGIIPGLKRRIELPSVAARVAKGQSLFLTVSPVADMFGGHGSRTPGALLLEDLEVHVPVK